VAGSNVEKSPLGKCGQFHISKHEEKRARGAEKKRHEREKNSENSEGLGTPHTSATYNGGGDVAHHQRGGRGQRVLG